MAQSKFTHTIRKQLKICLTTNDVYQYDYFDKQNASLYLQFYYRDDLKQQWEKIKMHKMI